ncbi:MAG: acetylornithine deacetylase/succinyl-diaminopimelate desuccinylase family protein [Acidobacteriota bacterium]
MLDRHEEQVSERIEKLAGEMIAFLQTLVRIPTINPPGDNYRPCAIAIGNQMRSFGYEVRFIEAEGLAEHTAKFPRVNAIGTIAGRGPTLHFNGHTDVVPPGAGWSVDPFAATIKDGCIYGRGVTDQKAGLAASLFAIEAIRREGIHLNGSVVQSATVDEESGGFAGVAYLARHGFIRREETDYVIITEPLDYNRVCLGHRGVYWFEVETRGKIAHGSMPFLGVSAIEKMSRFIDQIEFRLKPALNDRITSMPVEPTGARRATININSISGGQSMDELQTPCVADRCRAIFDRRFLIEEDFDEVREEIIALLEEMRREDEDFDYELKDVMTVHPTMTLPESTLVSTMQSAIRDVTDEQAQLIASPGTYDQKHFAHIAGIRQCIAYGPGILALAHKPDEYCRIDRLVASCKAMALAAMRLLGQ